MQWACFWHEVWFNSSHYHWVYVLFFSSPTANETRCWITEGVSMKEQRWLQQSHMDVGTPWAFLYDAAELSAHHAILCVCTWHLLLWYLVNTHYLRRWKRDHFSYSFFFPPYIHQFVELTLHKAVQPAQGLVEGFQTHRTSTDGKQNLG